MRSIWKGSINFMVVSIPAKLYSATDDKRVSFHQYHTCGSRVTMPKFCAKCQKQVEHLTNPLGIKVARKQYPVQFYAFDILSYDYDSVMPCPLIERKAILDKVLTDSYQSQKLPWYIGQGRKLLERTEAMNLEGILRLLKFLPAYRIRLPGGLYAKHGRPGARALTVACYPC